MSWFNDRILLSKKQAEQLQNDLMHPSVQEAKQREDFFKRLNEEEQSGKDDVNYEALDQVITQQKQK